MNKRIALAVMAVLLTGTLVWAAKEQSVDRYAGQFPLWLDKGLYVGTTSNPNAPTGDKVNKIAAIRTCDLQNVDIPAAAANVQSEVTATCTGMAVGDVIVGIAPQQDDAAWDVGNLNGFVETANTIKIQYMADSTGGDPAATNDYFVTFIKRN